MKPDPKALLRLSSVAAILRDRDLQNAAVSLRRLAETDRQIGALDALREAAHKAMRNIETPGELLRYQAYADLTEGQRARLSRTRAEQTAALEEILAEARFSLARSDLLATLGTAARKELICRRSDKDVV